MNISLTKITTWLWDLAARRQISPNTQYLSNLCLSYLMFCATKHLLHWAGGSPFFHSCCCCAYRRSCGCPSSGLASFNSSWVLPFSYILHGQTVCLYSCWTAHPCFHLVCKLLLCVSSFLQLRSVSSLSASLNSWLVQRYTLDTTQCRISLQQEVLIGNVSFKTKPKLLSREYYWSKKEKQNTKQKLIYTA